MKFHVQSIVLACMFASTGAIAQLPPLESFPQGPNKASPCYQKRCTPEEMQADYFYERQRTLAQYAAKIPEAWATEYVKEQADLWSRLQAESGSSEYWTARAQSCAKLPALVMVRDENARDAIGWSLTGTGPFTTLSAQSPELVAAYNTANAALRLYEDCVRTMERQGHAPKTGLPMVRGSSRMAWGPSANDLEKIRWNGLGTAAPIVLKVQVDAWKEPQREKLTAWLKAWQSTLRVGTKTLENGPVLAIKGAQVRITKDICIKTGVQELSCRLTNCNTQEKHEGFALVESCAQWAKKAVWVDRIEVAPQEPELPRDLPWAVHDRWGIGTGWRPTPTTDVDWVSEGTQQCMQALASLAVNQNTCAADGTRWKDRSRL